VGPAEIAERAAGQPPGTLIGAPRDLLALLRPDERMGCHCTVTYTVDVDGRLRVADRHSEHVACAGGAPVLAAGELEFVARRDRVEITQISNQSTGYCPEPSSWPAVQAALENAGLDAPDAFTHAFLFRCCPVCTATNLVKDQIFECALCGADLPLVWNFDPLQIGRADE
jgi:hypothetical protein